MKINLDPPGKILWRIQCRIEFVLMSGMENGRKKIVEEERREEREYLMQIILICLDRVARRAFRSFYISIVK